MGVTLMNSTTEKEETKMAMIAKYDSQCYLCGELILAGQEIERNNADRGHRSYVHASCNPAAGIHTRAGFRVEVVQQDPSGWIPVGTKRQYVREAMAEAVAQKWRELGCKQVAVIPL